jgi:imidazolonepropionase
MMGKIIAVGNLKGGTGKGTIAVNLACGLAKRARSVALIDADVTPVLLPGTAFGLGADYADGRAMVEAGAAVAVATDFNPNCHSRSMGFAQSLACVEMGMTPAQALVAATEHAALALDRPNRGRLEPGTPADIAVVDAPSHVHVPYQFGENTVAAVFTAGDRVV